ncbi:MAG: 8-amino-7-oxononanoate synthase [Thiohalocapsa sp.]|uniref:8-amino-7-oxononanoate synthase n=1 Tax=Thiohalocapsa sp. TaxID=2497641 RepID=UPI0025F5F149|nr:8-amino-7-oxononanoate synthase [Thiohalocapsa sp.]MCG6941095.1 8-amino-7-oxononanoate synthase [Thiohalocapsa sp.]
MTVHRAPDTTSPSTDADSAPGADGWDADSSASVPRDGLPSLPDAPAQHASADADAALAAELERLRRENLYRARRVLEGPQGVRPVIDGRGMLSFCSNDYLGLAAHPVLADALREGVARYGVGSGAAHLISGHSEAHRQLELDLADFTGRPRALLFSTGYMANLGVISALCARGEHVYADRLNHASLNDGARLAGARLKRYPHRDVAALERMSAGPGASMIITDGVFSMDGDIAPLPELARVAQAAGARLMVDDAHGLGVVGRAGRGTLDLLRMDDLQVPILVGTLGKAFGTFGAFVAGSEALIETLIQRARSYIYTTALPPAVAHATSAALALAVREEWRREHLHRLIARFRHGAAALDLPLMESHTPIQPLLAGDSLVALEWSLFLENNGVLVSAIRPPTVPKGAARLRITLSAAHHEQDIDRLLELLGRLPRRRGRVPRANGGPMT